ncbi:iron complex transport system substrate-binding protein [Dethiosulfatibacter aminovorans DSM 17477]|uniref:Iron complex transport system substrate-binding protein n=1 Tax=Dethiosulfatibacter aminovorans DSM 17477 TaxID=1121476 RepID=A0A1M6KAT5_9FIRM|nr:ABC transporter substrate-binding protein [Dethiosulfatibacter aminovorans]SHJ56060.1 iron complex transport system substrate-binding protein [Dethiosulfatibacter aminovorans DSM 17477]
MKSKILVLLSILSLSFIIGCSTGTADITEADNTDYTISFIDDMGNQINLNSPCERIIPLYSAHTENLYFLGAGDQIIGAYKTSIYPPEAAFLPRYLYQEDPEKIIAVNPDAVIIRPFINRKSPEFVEALENAGVLVVSLYPESFDEFDEYIEKLALLSGKTVEAEKLLKEFHEDIDGISQLTSGIEDKKTIFFESTDVNVRTVTSDSMPGLAIGFAGGINTAGDIPAMTEGSSIAPFGLEKVVEIGENIDVYISQRGAMNCGGNEKTILQRPGFETIKAVKEHKVYTINEKIISSPTFRYIKGVKEFARYLYPEILDSTEDMIGSEQLTRKAYAELVVKCFHLPVYTPASSHYYESEYSGHTYGLFRDVHWNDEKFDYVETAVIAGLVDSFKEDGKEYFHPNEYITKDELAKTIYLRGKYAAMDNHVEIADLEDSENKRIIQKLVDHKVFELDSQGKFNPGEIITVEYAYDILSKLN